MSGRNDVSKTMRSEAWGLVVEALDEVDPEWMKGATECAGVTAANWIRRTIQQRDESGDWVARYEDKFKRLRAAYMDTKDERDRALASLAAIKRRVIVDFGDGRFTVLRPAVAHFDAATYEEAVAAFQRVYGLDEKEVVA